MTTKAAAVTIETHPLTPDRWRDFSTLMQSRFDTRHCWCMYWRLPVNYKTRTGDQNRRSMKRAVDTAPAPPGLLAYADGVPVGWCAIAPRPDYPQLAKSRGTAPIDDEPVWSVVCFYVLRRYRMQAVSRALLAAALDLAKLHGARVVEAYPVEGTRNLFRGMPSVFTAAGFEEVARRNPGRPILRYRIRARR